MSAFSFKARMYFRQDLDPDQMFRARKWISELRSGRHAQGYGSLVCVNTREPQGLSYCCLGVAAAFALGEEPDDGSPILDGKWAWALGLRGEGGQPDDPGWPELTWLNDAEGWDFEQIANLLEADLDRHAESAMPAATLDRRNSLRKA